nr:hypothetical protein [Tanacetum cinerariifolium]
NQYYSTYFSGLPVCTIYRTKGAGFCGREWGEVMGSKESGGEGAGRGEEGIAGLAGVGDEQL